ncbi:MAG: hypothetical protein JNJ83_20015 [Verrucomicrobiaceae bacterium]|nr:hypothetical protein [Verrucomicrobiaceae bacterium]
MNQLSLRCPAAALLLTVGLTSCDRFDQRVVEITETREVSKHASAPNVGVSSATRFYDDAQRDESGAPMNPFIWTTPTGWTEGQSNQMRVINLTFGPNNEGECYLTAMPGASGGVEANINRWRGQLGLSPLPAADVEKLPRKTFLGGEAYSVTADGDYKNVGQEAPMKDYRLVGLIQQVSGLTLFVKMTGPKALVETNQANFESFVNSINFRARQQ